MDMDIVKFLNFLHGQETDCKALQDEFAAANSSEVQCPPTFDGVLCWPRTSAPAIMKLSCPPRDILGYNYALNSTASKVCLENGSWYLNEQKIQWGDYTQCVAPDHQYLIAIQNIQISHLDYDVTANNPLFREWLPTLKIISQVGYATSFCSLIIAMIIFSLLRKLRNPRNRLHMHLFASFITRAGMALLKDWLFVDGLALAWDFVDGEKTVIKETNIWVCKAITTLWQYFIVANYAWILMEGLFLHNLVFLSPPATSEVLPYAIGGWIFPFIIVTVWVGVRIIMEDTFCWTTNDNPWLFLVIRIPIMISVLFNFILFASIVRLLLVKLKTSAQLQQRKRIEYGRWARSTLILVPLFGTHYAIFHCMSYYDDPLIQVIWLYCDQFFASFQGCFVAFLYCLLNNEVRNEIIRVWRIRKARREDSLDLSHRKIIRPSSQRSKEMQNDSSQKVIVAVDVSAL